MKKLLQIIYISRSTFESAEMLNKIEPNVARILAKSRVNNRKNGLVGVLYFGDGVFFQCLEGNEDTVNTLLQKLELDPRHRDLKIISRKYIDKLSFSDWAMKFAPLDERISQFLKENGFISFDPYLFSGEVINKFLKELFNANDPTLEFNSPPILHSANNNAPSQSYDVTSQVRFNLALILSIIATLISLLALLSSRHNI